MVRMYRFRRAAPSTESIINDSKRAIRVDRRNHQQAPGIHESPNAAKEKPRIGEVLDHLTREDDIEFPFEGDGIEIFKVGAEQVPHPALFQLVETFLVEIESPEVFRDAGHFEMKQAPHLQPHLGIRPVGAAQMEHALPPANLLQVIHALDQGDL